MENASSSLIRRLFFSLPCTSTCVSLVAVRYSSCRQLSYLIIWLPNLLIPKLFDPPPFNIHLRYCFGFDCETRGQPASVSLRECVSKTHTPPPLSQLNYWLTAAALDFFQFQRCCRPFIRFVTYVCDSFFSIHFLDKNRTVCHQAQGRSCSVSA